VYTDYSGNDVMVFNTQDGTTVNLTSDSRFDSLDPAIGGDLVVWTDDRDGNWKIYAKDLRTGVERRVSNSLDLDSMAKVSNGIIVWQRCYPILKCDIFAYDWASETTRQITNTLDGDERVPHVDGNRIVYQANRDGQWDICMFDLTSGIEKCLSLPGDQVNAHISGDFVSFDDQSHMGYHIGLWQLSSDRVFEVTGGMSGQYLNDIDGNRVVYTDDRNGDRGGTASDPYFPKAPFRSTMGSGSIRPCRSGVLGLCR
jgi:beta propeller repeat protein